MISRYNIFVSIINMSVIKTFAVKDDYEPSATSGLLKRDYTSSLSTLALSGANQNPVNLTYRASRVGDVVTLTFFDVTLGDINVSSAISSAALAEKYRPFQTASYPLRMKENSTLLNGKVIIQSNGVIQFYSKIDQTGWTINAGDNNIYGSSVSYVRA